jgi:hypothetical protein
LRITDTAINIPCAKIRVFVNKDKELTTLSAAGRILRMLQLYFLNNRDQAYEANRRADELGIDPLIEKDAVKSRCCDK